MLPVVLAKLNIDLLLNYWGQVTQNASVNWAYIGSDNDLVPNKRKSVCETMMAYYQLDSNEQITMQFAPQRGYFH